MPIENIFGLLTSSTSPTNETNIHMRLFAEDIQQLTVKIERSKFNRSLQINPLIKKNLKKLS